MKDVMQMKADDNRDERARALRILGIIVLVIGLLVAVGQTFGISDGIYWANQAGLLGNLCWIAIGMALEIFGIGLIIVGNRK